MAQAGALIISIEPIPQNLERQKRNVNLNKYADLVRYCEVALGSTEGEVRISFDSASGDNNAIVADNGDTTVPVTTLDQIVKDVGCGRVGLIKIDVEGYEPKVVEGAIDTIKRDRPIVFAEFNRERMAINGFDMAPSWDFFRSCGYRVFQLSAEKLVPLEEPGLVENIYFLPV